MHLSKAILPWTPCLQLYSHKTPYFTLIYFLDSMPHHLTYMYLCVWLVVCPSLAPASRMKVTQRQGLLSALFLAGIQNLEQCLARDGCSRNS